ncbi:Protein-glutamate methylesterase/protein-glutamine glutaminase [Paenibacillus sp. JJ-100]|uniref:response regulator n=1 Tax=Paenibacillus sp. JJ-100 TaxID=2974896 RepID=UPI0022FF664F|nr:response regulator [Paenibacillus sp. JJ-100]CAI6047445.1 Protein-glutamate methylesterase/protein-glutamine glutaminase [Paenibacillus sp. JJ-100]
MYKLLIVEDELLMRVGIRSMLNWEEYGFYVSGEACNGKEALEIALEKVPDLIITDIRMPVMDGLQFIKEASQSLKYCKYVILSNFDELQYVKKALKLGATDYLIKSEINEQSLIQLLRSVRSKLESEQNLHRDSPHVNSDYYKSIRYLKDSFFQDIVSGFTNEKELNSQVAELQFRIQSERLVAIKFIVNHYEQLKRKYIEKGEKLLRFSILNIMEEVIPSRWAKEIFVESSSEYWVVVNVNSDMDSDVYGDLNKLIRKIMASMKDFMNLSITAGVSSVVSGFTSLRSACREAESALKERFFTGGNQILHVKDVREAPSREEVVILLNPEQEQHFMKCCISKNRESAELFLEDIRTNLKNIRADENSIRKQYITVLETMHAHLLNTTSRKKILMTEKSPYEIVLNGEHWNEIHRDVMMHITETFNASAPATHELKYTDLATDIINTYYAEDLSLQSVAGQINVHPSYLSRLFKQQKGENFISYLTRTRIEHAKAYLLSKELKVYEIADKVGYHNYTYFSKIFKKTTGLTPEEYREQQHSHITRE